jgi:hypothetical protein
MTQQPARDARESSIFRLDAVGVGPQRTATSWLHEVLTVHPGLCLPRGVKETMFFDERFDKGLSWYAWHFRHRLAGQQCIEIAPTYFDRDVARARLAAHHQGLRVIVTARNPVTRAYSLYRLHLAKGRVRGSFAEAVREMPRILTSGHYAVHAAAWEHEFGRDRVHYVLQEDVRADPARVIAHICAFLGVAEMPLPRGPARHDRGLHAVPRYPRLARTVSSTATILRGWRLHGLVNIGKLAGLKGIYRAGGASLPLTPELYGELVDRFALDIDFLEARLGRDLSGWRRWDSHADR